MVVSKVVVYEWVSVQLTMFTISRIDNDAKENDCYLLERWFQRMSFMIERVSVELTRYTICRIDNGAKENHCYLLERWFQRMSFMNGCPLN
jgi:hypothetical protein